MPRVRANVAVYGLQVGDVADVADEGEIHNLIDSGLLSVVSGPSGDGIASEAPLTPVEPLADAPGADPAA